MLVKIIKDGKCEEFNLEASSIPGILCLLKLAKGQAFTDELISNSYKFIAYDSTMAIEPLSLSADVYRSSLGGFDTLIIIQDIDGQIAAPLVALAFGSAFAATTAGTILIAVINVALSFAVSALMNMISPTPEQSTSDPSHNKKASNLFNGGILTQEQGGSVPFIFGQCFCGGIVISAGTSTRDE